MNRTRAVNRAIDVFLATNELRAAFRALLDVDEMARAAYEWERSKNTTKHQEPAWEALTETDKNPHRTRVRAIRVTILGSDQ